MSHGIHLDCPYRDGMLMLRDTYGNDHLFTCDRCPAEWSSSGYPQVVPDTRRGTHEVGRDATP